MKTGLGLALSGLGILTGSKLLKYESGMKIENATELNIISDSLGVKNSGYRTTNI